jgi:hypothetical protein
LELAPHGITANLVAPATVEGTRVTFPAAGHLIWFLGSGQPLSRTQVRRRELYPSVNFDAAAGLAQGAVDLKRAPNSPEPRRGRTLDRSALDRVPVFDQDYISTISRFLDNTGTGTNGVTLIVNGVEEITTMAHPISMAR